jgi:hypothetical protein
MPTTPTSSTATSSNLVGDRYSQSPR